MLQSLTKLGYLLRETFSGLRRGGWMNWAAISTVTVLLFLFGICVQTSWQLDSLLNHFGSQLEISVYLEPDVQGETLLSQVERRSEVKQVRMISKDQAWESLLQELGVTDMEEATQQLEGNPLVDELKVLVKDADTVPRVVEELSAIPGVDRCVYVNEARERFKQLQWGLNWVSLSLTVILSFTAIAVVTTTLNLIAVSRRNELEIMQLVGATKVWIFLPFIVQGVIFGVVGGGLALTLLTSLRTVVARVLVNQTDFLRFIVEGLQLNPLQLYLLAFIIFSLGISVGTISSFFAIRRFSFR
ncbi:ABC transporter permease [Spirulina sp. CS-785/01]|uniref:cell division protein FtsX n=1 Tax=Spirulina sp. CS-785/01 TaxID=3021716 RepID=UPI00232CEB45|nr:ABC transporter permease [Spirulina sp. CS-785/01]MDB9314657.1 ABC transporter permease [Spirulina sp. CS-785/01]